MRVHKNVAVLRGKDAAVLKELQAVMPLDDLVIHWLGNTVAVLNSCHLDRIIKNMERFGYRPKVVSK